VTDIQTAAQAANALKPIAGEFAFGLFALGILGVGLIGVPVLAGSAGYAMAEAMGWTWGLERKATDARGFYGVITVAVLAGMLLEYTPINPMKALFWSAVINGVVAVPLLVLIILLASRCSVMGEYTASRTLIMLGWIAAAVMGAASVLMFIPVGR
jgi:Mn2+/Fe2+ NRAMP family transporter